SNNSDVSKTLNYVNSLFSLYNEYNTKLAIDTDSNELIFTDDFSELRGNFGAVEFRRSNELMGLYCKSGAECMSVADVDTGVSDGYKAQYTFGLQENDEAIPEMDRAIEKLNAMLVGLSGGASGSSSSSLSSVAKSNLKIINDAFDEYNSYETVFSVKGKNLHWDSSVANVSASLNNLTFYIDYENNWMVMRCTDGDCLEGSSSKDSYSMGLSTSSGIAPNIEKVLQAFNDLRREILTN
ncbi:MAG: hypothetical protein JKY22_04610, partial [Flavobacteriaceae bacterium]|nr:hypothetical protein [Flavobacteriaceae bacterium]